MAPITRPIEDSIIPLAHLTQQSPYFSRSITAFFEKFIKVKLLGGPLKVLSQILHTTTTSRQFECLARQLYIQPKISLALACVHFFIRTGIIQVSSQQSVSSQLSQVSSQ